jgi:hypothetical protein
MTGFPKFCPSIWNCTVPVGVPVPARAVTVAVKVTLCPKRKALLAADERTAVLVSTVRNVALLLAGAGSPVSGPADAVLEMLGPDPAINWTTKVNVAEALEASEPVQAVAVPVLPAAGAVRDQPLAVGDVSCQETRLVPAGSTSARVTSD